MSNSGYPYRETLLQWIWQELEFDTTSLITITGKRVEIINPGKINSGAGPDFRGAEVRIDGMKFFGDVEIHVHNDHWAQHNHQHSHDFNSVILHVIYDADVSRSKPAKRPDGTTPPLLDLKPYLQKSLNNLLVRKRSAGLPCSGQVHFINQRAFETQIEKAHKDYFEYKTNFLLTFYNSSLPVTKAWLGLFTGGIFHTLGIPRNREQMEQFHSRLQNQKLSPTLEAFVALSCDLAFTHTTESEIDWVTSGMRPASRPSNRIHQAAALYYSIYTTPFKTFLSATEDIWPGIIKRVPEELRPGKQMRIILKHTVFYPATYLLGEFLHAKKVKSFAYTGWLNASGSVPSEVSQPFKSSGFQMNSSTRKPGLAHQLKRYCRPMNCHRCEVFKKAINP